MTPTPSLQAYLDHKLIRTLDDHRANYERTMFFLRKLKPIQAGQTFLEVGCGAGWSCILAAREGYRVTGIDVRPEFIGVAQKRAEAMDVAVDFLVGNAEQIGLQECSFDIVFAECVLEHVPQWQKAVANMHRVLKPGGALYLSTTNRSYPISTEVEFPLYQYLPRSLQVKVAKSIKGPDVMDFGFAWNYFTHPMLRSHLEDLGFAPVRDILDLLDRQDINRPWVKKVYPLVPLSRRYDLLKRMLYVGLSITALYAIKQAR